MTAHDRRGSTALLDPATSPTASRPASPEPYRPPRRWGWLLTALATVAVAGFLAWTLTQTGTDGPVEATPSVHSDHDGLIQLQLRDRERAAQAQADPRVEALHRNQPR